ncbi:TPA: hypothetical protein HA265_04170 [Candidatus Woesearchaeota archaeon]|nr:hypothetical protein [Candidatus Woesearchaeota archaeon]
MTGSVEAEFRKLSRGVDDELEAAHEFWKFLRAAQAKAQDLFMRLKKARGEYDDLGKDLSKVYGMINKMDVFVGKPLEEMHSYVEDMISKVEKYDKEFLKGGRAEIDIKNVLTFLNKVKDSKTQQEALDNAAEVNKHFSLLDTTLKYWLIAAEAEVRKHSKRVMEFNPLFTEIYDNSSKGQIEAMEQSVWNKAHGK